MGRLLVALFYKAVADNQREIFFLIAFVLQPLDLFGRDHNREDLTKEKS